MEYSDYEIKRLHWELYDILDEIQRVCDILHIKCFIQGGSAIGAFFEQAILPWDDDIDVGMLRDDYERFLREASQLLGPKYFLQWVGSEKHMPHVLAKVRKNGTEFREYYYRNVSMHQGIYVDIMPYDKVPDTVWLQSLQRGVLRFLTLCVINQEVWGWKYFKTSMVDEPATDRFFTCLGVLVCSSLLSKKALYKLFSIVSSIFNGWNTLYYSQAKEYRDHISVTSLENLQLVPFGPLMSYVPDNVEEYLRHHYPNLRRTIPKEEQVSHGPAVLKFSDDSKDFDSFYVKSWSRKV